MSDRQTVYFGRTSHSEPSRFCCDGKCMQGRCCPAVDEIHDDQPIDEEFKNMFMIATITAYVLYGALIYMIWERV